MVVGSNHSSVERGGSEVLDRTTDVFSALVSASCRQQLFYPNRLHC